MPSLPRSTQATETNAPPRRRNLAALIVGLLVGFLITVLAVHFIGVFTRSDTSSPAIVNQIRKLSRLETVVYSMDKIVTGERQFGLLPDFLTGDKLLLIAHGEVIAGVDLSQLKSTDVVVNGTSITVHLPQPQILSASLDSQRTRVYSRSTGLLVTADPDLETKIRQAAEQQITQAAITDGILSKAHQNAQSSVTALLSTMGFHSIEID